MGHVLGPKRLTGEEPRQGPRALGLPLTVLNLQRGGEVAQYTERSDDLSSDTEKFIRLIEREVLAESHKRSKQKAQGPGHTGCEMCSVKLSLKKKAPIQWKQLSLFDAYWMPTKESAAHRYKCDLKS